ncbi:uncharacterized membrane protein YcaP (DUF421 family) [Hydrogenoanaerobacterium saccharovorans]|uniref:Uncharacterized membrane protein YcaP, DUF421 family n=1 Tax=Hydrogenoanaerobacterium saccharovorans TaxID=474960 RepID=A0A1H7ZY42_9FIRM|nr:DUF421 domain-containing protein [Hydrogenoanaerobacterium saccharovorans]RPF48308.1 uncharacterized membrane protein YcaP (DUF421 family) [Hydrogenoanaerobacterium saccharovorans]SEM63156.1 Uncharacterized membrane protein YcaP, DUF421 family [Hydrogenoanaerobacterium saccharovorans]
MSIFFLRTIILYFVIVFSLRIMGKRHLGELQPSEFVVAIMISNIATLPIEDTNIPLVAGIVPILTLVSFEVIISSIGLKCKTVRKLVSGNPIIIIRDGVIDQKKMRELRYSIDDLIEQLRSKDIFDISEVAYAIVETNGQLSVFQKYPYRITTNEDLNIPEPSCADSPPMVLISDGELIEDTLNYCNLRKEWLEKTLREQGVEQKDIFIMTCNRAANYHLVLREKKKKENKGGGGS